VRLINANTLDLALFQLTTTSSTMFFNGDGTITVVGSWTHQRDSQNTTISSYQRAIEAALAIHRGYPANKATLAAKQGSPIPFKTPTEIPLLAAKYKPDLDWEGKVVQSCVHCHQIGDAIRTSYREQNKPMPVQWIYPWPAPETIGLTLAPDHIAHGSLPVRLRPQPV
jgi:hypothetical protein